ncbi:MAG TPA: copper homeostasis membrane protein CopD [Stellaceae bacterium]|nr:copper homeostasis membrane protein CopD [Stellaceae bacterium]
MDDAAILFRLVHFAAAMAAFGAAAFRYYVPRHDGAFDGWLARLIRVAAAVGFLAALALVPTTAARMAGSAAAGFDSATLATVLTGTEFGHVWCWHLGFAAALVVAASRRPGAIVLALSGLSLASLGWVGHAAMMGGLPGLGHELNQTLHLLAAGAWLGGLPPLYALLRRAAPGDPAIPDAVAHFSQMGYAAVAVIAVTGVVNSCLLVGSVGALVATAYGRLLTAKIAVYLVMVAIALVNRLSLAPRLGRGGAAALARSVVVEQALGLGVLAIVSVLGTWAPAAMHHAM